MTPEALLELVAVVMALFFAYFPKIKEWYDGLDLGSKLLIQAGVIAATVGVLFGLSCAEMFEYFSCDWAGGQVAIWLFVRAIVLNQGIYQAAVRLPRKILGRE